MEFINIIDTIGNELEKSFIHNIDPTIKVLKRIHEESIYSTVPQDLLASKKWIYWSKLVPQYIVQEEYMYATGPSYLEAIFNYYINKKEEPKDLNSIIKEQLSGAYKDIPRDLEIAGKTICV